MENTESIITPQNPNKKKLLIGGIVLLILLVITAILVFFFMNQNSPETTPSASSDKDQTQTTTATFAPPVIAADSYNSKEYSGKILIATDGIASQIDLVLTTNPLLVNDIVLNPTEGNGWVIELSSYDQSQGKATLLLKPASGTTAPLSNPIASFTLTSKENILSQTLDVVVAPESTITLQNGTKLTITGSPFKFIYPDVAPLVQ